MRSVPKSEISTIAVTGASGFIGKHVLAVLADYPVDVVAVTRCVEKLSELSGNYKVVSLDMANPTPGDYETMGRPDVLIHLAWDGLPNYKSLHHFETELPRQYAFLKGLVEAGLPALLVTGTCFEYGSRSGELSEDYDTNPNNPYGFAKDALRKQLEYLNMSYPFALTWTRLFYMYGEGQASSSIMSKLIEAVANGEKAFNMSGGEQLRDYLPVTEVARLIVELALRGSDHGVVNICSGEPISVRKLVEKWLQEFGLNIDLNLGYYPYPDYEPMAFWGSRKKLDGIVSGRKDL